MDFIEQWFGVSPDGGDGSLEILYVIGAVAVVVAIVGRNRIRRYLAGLRELPRPDAKR